MPLLALVSLFPSMLKMVWEQDNPYLASQQVLGNIKNIKSQDIDTSNVTIS